MQELYEFFKNRTPIRQSWNRNQCLTTPFLFQTIALLTHFLWGSVALQTLNLTWELKGAQTTKFLWLNFKFRFLCLWTQPKYLTNCSSSLTANIALAGTSSYSGSAGYTDFFDRSTACDVIPVSEKRFNSIPKFTAGKHRFCSIHNFSKQRNPTINKLHRSSVTDGRNDLHEKRWGEVSKKRMKKTILMKIS